MTTDELKALADDNTLGIDVTRDEKGTDSTLIGNYWICFLNVLIQFDLFIMVESCGVDYF